MDESRRGEISDLTGWVCHFLANQNLPKGAKPKTPKECAPWKTKAQAKARVVKVSTDRFFDLLAGKKKNGK